MYSLPENPSEYIDGAEAVNLIDDAGLQYKEYYQKASKKDKHRLRTDIQMLDVAIDSMYTAHAFSMSFPALLFSMTTLSLSIVGMMLSILNWIRTPIDVAKDLKELWGDAALEKIQLLASQTGIVQSLSTHNQNYMVMTLMIMMLTILVMSAIIIWLFRRNAKSRKKGYYKLYCNACQQRLDELLAGEAQAQCPASVAASNP